MKSKKVLFILLALVLVLSLAGLAQAATHTHQWMQYSRTEPTCTQAGQIVYTCSCGETRTEAIPAAGHRPEILPGQPATCDVNGLTEGSRCTVCGAILRAQSPIPAYGHNWGPWQQGKLPTCEEKGKNYSVCTICGATRYRDDIEPLGHDWDEGVVTKEAGYLEEGEITYTCKRDSSHTKTETLPVREPPEGQTIMMHLRSGSIPQPYDVDLIPTDTPLIIIENPESGALGSESGSLELRVEADGGVQPYSYEWHRESIPFLHTETLAEAAAASWKAGPAADYCARAEKAAGIFTMIAGQQETASAEMTATPATILPSEAVSLPLLDLSVIVGGNSPVFTADSAGVYYCVVTDAEGAEVTSEKAEVRSPLYISRQPGSANIYGKDSVTLVCRAAGGTPFDNGTYIFAWYNSRDEQVAFTDDGTAEVTEQGDYYCLVQDYGDTVLKSETAVVYSAKPLTITEESNVYYIMPGGDPVNVNMEVRGGVPPYELMWSGNDQEELMTYQADEGIHSWNTDIPGAYFLTVTDSMGEMQVGASDVEYEPLKIVRQPVGGLLKDDGYFDLTIEVADGKEPYRYELYWNDDLLDITSDTAMVACAGEYYFHVEDADGRWVNSDRVTVEDYVFAIDHIEMPDGSILQSKSTPLTLVPVLKSETANVSYRWTWRPASGNYTSEPLPDGETCKASKPGIYLCIATNEEGKAATASAEVTYTGKKPVILVQPQNQVYSSKDESGCYYMVMRISAVGSDNREDTLHYEWQVKESGGWTILSSCSGIGETKLRRSSSQYSGISGVYRCVVTDPATGQSVTSREALAYYYKNTVNIETTTHKKDYYVDLKYEIRGGIPPYEISLYRSDAIKRIQTNPDVFDYFTVRIKHFKTEESIGDLTIISTQYFMQDGKTIKYTPRYYFEISDGTGQTYTTPVFDYTGYLSN